MELKGSLPCSVKIFKDPSFSSEDRALAELINGSEFVKEGVVVFDRGLRARNALEKFTSENKLFVTRAYVNMKYEATSSLPLPPRPVNTTLTIESDEVAYLFNQHDQKTKHLYRVIKARVDKTSAPICFVTNMLEENSYQLTEWYKQRWDIEVFFKFLKQHLNAKHLVSRDENGIKVMIYMTLIVAILILVYKKLNQIKFYKMARLEFELELDNEITKAIVILCGGDPALAPHLFANNRSG
jgi:IS4 transposase